MNKLDEILTIYRVKHSKLINLCDDGEITEEQYSEGLLDIRMEAKQAIIELIEGEIIGDKIVQYFLKSSTNKDILGLMYQIINSDSNDKVKINGLENIIENFYEKVKRFNERGLPKQVELLEDKKEMRVYGRNED